MAVWCWSLKRLTAARVAVWVYLVPIIAALSSWLFRGSRITPGTMLGAALILLGLALTQRRARIVQSKIRQG